MVTHEIFGPLPEGWELVQDIVLDGRYFLALFRTNEHHAAGYAFAVDGIEIFPYRSRKSTLDLTSEEVLIEVLQVVTICYGDRVEEYFHDYNDMQKTWVESEECINLKYAILNLAGEGQLRLLGLERAKA